MTQETRTLVLLRHASAQEGSGDDLARELTQEGCREAARLGAWLQERDLLGDVVLCSPSMRTRQTWAVIEEETGHGVMIDFDDSIYEAAPEAIISSIRGASPDARVVVLIGHAPGVPYAAYMLCDGHGDAGAVARLNTFEPASAAVIQFEGEWADLNAGAGELLAVRLGGETSQ